MADAESKMSKVGQQIPEAEIAAERQYTQLVEAMVEAFVQQSKDALPPEVQEILCTIIRFCGPGIKGKKITKDFLNQAEHDADKAISAQMDEVLHHEKFQKLEAAWKGLKWLVDETDFRQNIRFDLLNASKDDLLQDFEDTVGDIMTTGLYKHVYREHYGMPGGKPCGAVLLNYEFSHRAPDMTLLNKVAEISSMAWSPTISAISPELFGPRGFEHLTDVHYNVGDVLSGRDYVKWNGFRENENARFVGLALPHFLLREPYDASESTRKTFAYSESIKGNNRNYLWGNAAFALASRLTQSFAKYRWCWKIVGEESGGKIRNMKVHVFTENGEKVQKPPTDVAISFADEKQLFDAGLSSLLWHKEKDFAVFYGVPSLKKPLKYPDTPEGREKERNDLIRTRLPFMFIASRFAHYLKRLQTRYIGEPTSRDAIEKELNQWIMQYVNQVKEPAPGTLGKHPLYNAKVIVEVDPKNSNRFICEAIIVPHRMPEGFSSTITMVTDLGGEKK